MNRLPHDARRSFARLALAALGAALTLAAASPARAQDDDGYRSGGELGGYFLIAPGAAGTLRNTTLISPGFMLAAGSRVRYHLRIGFGHMSGSSGVSADLVTLGIPIHVYTHESFGIAVEPLINILGVDSYFTPAISVWPHSGFGVQAVMNFRKAFVALSPLNFQFRFLTVSEATANPVATGFGLNMPIRVSGGMRF